MYGNLHSVSMAGSTVYMVVWYSADSMLTVTKHLQQSREHLKAGMKICSLNCISHIQL
ncbi:hypothetical protein PISMIDRAFT_682806, partial [Pisolithus microcarpus 441]